MNKVKTLSCYLECSSGCAPKVSSLKKFIDYLSSFGYQEFYLGLTDAYKIPEYPYFNYHRGSYSKEELKDIEGYAAKKGVKVIPAIQVLGHLEFIWRHESFRGFMDTRSILEVANPKAYAFVEAMFKSISESFSGRTIHIGMDETFGLGLGEYLNKHGLKDKKVLLLEYLKEVVKIAQKYGFKIEIWGDMLLDNKCTSISEEAVKKELPDDTLVWLWDYDAVDKKVIDDKIKDMKRHASEIGFAGCAWKHISYVANNNYSLPRLIKQIEVCGANNIDKYMVTIWGDFAIPSSIYSVLPSLFLASECNQNQALGLKLNKQKFYDIVGVSYDDLISLDLLNNPYKHDRSKYYNNTSYIAFFSDLLIGNYDLYASTGVNRRYLLLARKYLRIAKKTEDGYFRHYFEMISSYAKILSIKIHLAKKIREAYERQDKDTLAALIKNDLDKLIKTLRSFIPLFDVYYLNEYQAFGLEISQLHHSHMLGRAIYLKERLLDYIANDTAIGEFNEPMLKSNYIPDPTEDCYINNNFEWLITYNSNK